MANSVLKVVDEFVGMAAAADPVERPRILRRAATAFAQAANDPRNAHRKRELTNVGLEFAGAAQKAQYATTSDFLQLVRDTAEAYENLPSGSTHSTEAMDMLSAMPAITSGAGPGAEGGAPGAGGLPGQFAPRVSIAPASFDTNTTLGRTATVTYAPTAQQISQGILAQQTVAFWQGSKSESQAMSVDVSLVFAPTAVVSQNLLKLVIDSRPYAVIQYGADGNTGVSVPVDVGLGRRIIVVGNYVSVSVGMDAPRTGKNSDSPVISVGASIGCFAAPSQAPVTRSLYIDSAAPGVDSAAFPLPLRAVQLLPPLGALTTDTIAVNFLSFSGVPIGSWTTGNPLPFPVPPDAYYVTITSTTGLLRQGPGIRIPFELSL